MKNIFLTLFFLLFIFSCNQTKHYDSLEERIVGLLDSEKGEFAVAYKNLTTGETILINQNEKFHAASTMKTPVMIEAFKKNNEGLISLDDSILIKNEFRQAFKNSFLIVDSSYTQGYEETDGKKTPGSRNHIFANFRHSFLEKENSYSDLEINLQHVSNDTYLEVHDIKTDLVEKDQDVLKNEIKYQYQNDDEYFGLVATAYEDLNKDFVSDHSSKELLSVKPPYFIKLKTAQQIAYTFKNDTLPPISHILNPNKELDLNPFVEKSEIVFNATKGLTLFINATELKQVSGYKFPLRLIFEPTPPSISIQRFKPIFK